MKKKEAFIKMRYDVETKFVNAFFHTDDDWSKNAEYQEMIKLGNFYEATKEEFLLCCNSQYCVIDGILQLYIEAENVKLEKAIASKLKKLELFYTQSSAWQCTLQASDGTLTRDKNWLRDNITLTSSFKNDQGIEFVKNFTGDEVLQIRDKLQAFGNIIRLKKEDVSNKISLCKNIEDVEKIDIESEFANIDRIINIL